MDSDERLTKSDDGSRRRLSNAQRIAEEAKLLKSIADHQKELDELLEQCSDHWGYEDPIYRFYHQSFKVYNLQETTETITKKLQELAPHLQLNQWFMEIVQAGTGKEFVDEHNDRWTEVTRPIVEAFFHARYFLEMICKYDKILKEPQSLLPSGWAAVLYLYRIR